MKKIAVGTTIGIGGASMLFGGVEWLLAKREYNAWRKLDQVATNQSKARAKAYNQALMGDVLMGVGIVGVAGGIAMATLWHPRASVEDLTDAGASEPPTHRRRKRRAAALLALPQVSLSPVAHGAQLVGAWELR